MNLSFTIKLMLVAIFFIVVFSYALALARGNLT